MSPPANPLNPCFVIFYPFLLSEWLSDVSISSSSKTAILFFIFKISCIKLIEKFSSCFSTFFTGSFFTNDSSKINIAAINSNKIVISNAKPLTMILSVFDYFNRISDANYKFIRHGQKKEEKIVSWSEIYDLVKWIRLLGYSGEWRLSKCVYKWFWNARKLATATTLRQKINEIIQKD